MEAFKSLCDYRIKDDVVNITDGRNFIMELRPVTYTLTLYPSAGTVPGFIAHEVAEAVPAMESVVLGEKDDEELNEENQLVPVYQQIILERIIPYAVAGIQSALTELDAIRDAFSILTPLSTLSIGNASTSAPNSSGDTDQNQIANNLNDLADKFNSLLDVVGDLVTRVNVLTEAGATTPA